MIHVDATLRPMDLSNLPVAGLLSLYSDVLTELRRREVIRSTNNPVADYAEHVATQALGLSLAPKSTTGYDAVDAAGLRYEIKARRLTRSGNSRQLSALRGLDSRHFDILIGLLFREDFVLQRACLVPHEVVLARSSFRKHTNSWVFHLRDEVWDLPGVRDITDRVRQAQEAQ